MYEYKGYTYQPEILEDEDTRRYIHDVYFGKDWVYRAPSSHWNKLTLEQFKLYVESLIDSKSNP